MAVEKRISRREARAQALSALFQVYIGGNEVDVALANVHDFFNEDVEEAAATDAFVAELVHGVLDHIAEIDELIQNNAEGWSIKRMGNIELNAVRIATFELLHPREDTSNKVVLNEAIEIVKAYSIDEKPSKFVNAILQKISHAIEAK